MATTNNGIWTPDQVDSYNLVGDLATMASTVDGALEERANAYRGTTAQRTAFTNTAPEGTIWVDTNGEKAVWVKQGNSWEQIWPVRQGDIPGMPYAMAGGVVTITGSGGITANTRVTFPPGRFTLPPLVPSIRTNNINFNTSWSSLDSSGVDIYIRRMDLAPFSNAIVVHWQAIQMSSSSSQG